MAEEECPACGRRSNELLAEWRENIRLKEEKAVLKRALFNLQTFVRKRGLYQTYLRAQARQELAEEAKDA